MDPVVIVGAGLAGYTVAREFRRQDKKAPLVVVTADGGDYYSKPALSNAIAQGQAPAALVLNTAEQMAKSLRAEVLTRKAVVSIDRAARRITWKGGELAYSKLVLALGSRCNRPPIGGDAAVEMLGVNSLEDYRAFRARLEGARRVVILGAGLVGCEIANDLAIGGYEPRLVEMATQVLPRLLDAQAAQELAERLLDAGVAITLGARVGRINRAGAALRVSLEAGETLAADLVLAATGLVPQAELAAAAGLVTKRAIVVDSFLRTSDPNIHALGDCAEVRGRWLPYTEPIRHAARALGATLAGRPTEVAYPEMPVELKTPAWPLVISSSIAAAA
jgi:rubredoxin-NAD+ reductase